ncbi:LysM peptidoglycan-binding domain-containing protein [Paludibacter sp. 221]|uniref:glucosaminidase domain-containing protein n=1 Tax=Paludibacter sp. 221 TaxID=2302939 RepID=UPI0013D0F902|nr:glucosaminidase domain-containing protein [Paludibacter sp. 221]NDV45787.1 LysM peptidoglycan-binding domain-containing protein [Paludibacter sp. 221]
MTRVFWLLMLLMFPFLAFSQHGNNAYFAYIENYNKMAVQQQNEHGIPASITLAQGLLESGAGKSPLAVKANNHFGIKCHDWTGAKMYYDDDKKNECFRKYRRVLDSYEDHSAFLKNRSRYASLFELEPTDYKGWAHGLKKAGYATDPTYAYKLISIIEEYELHRFDLQSTKDKTKRRLFARKTKEKPQPSTIEEKVEDALPSNGSVYAVVIHQLMRVNGLKYVVAVEGDTYGSIADEFNLKADDVASYNEMAVDAKLKQGERVYLQKKKKQAPKGFEKHVIQPGESLYGIAQYYGIRLIDLFDMNNIPYDGQAAVGQVVKLRP